MKDNAKYKTSVIIENLMGIKRIKETFKQTKNYINQSFKTNY